MVWICGLVLQKLDPTFLKSTGGNCLVSMIIICTWFIQENINRLSVSGCYWLSSPPSAERGTTTSLTGQWASTQPGSGCTNLQLLISSSMSTARNWLDLILILCHSLFRKKQVASVQHQSSSQAY